MGHHLNSDRRFQSDKHPKLKPDHIVLDLGDPAAKGPIRLFARNTKDRGVAEDLITRLDEMEADDG